MEKFVQYFGYYEMVCLNSRSLAGLAVWLNCLTDVSATKGMCSRTVFDVWPCVALALCVRAGS